MSDPIVGIATAAGEGGIAIVRISGDGAANYSSRCSGLRASAVRPMKVTG